MVFPEDTPVCSPGACMWINTDGSHLNLTAYHCQIFLDLFFHHSVNTSPESCQFFSKILMFLRCRCPATAGMEAEEESGLAQPLSQPAPSAPAATLQCCCPGSFLESTGHLHTDLSAGWDMPWKTTGSHLSWKQSCPENQEWVQVLHKLHDLPERQVRETPFKKMSFSKPEPLLGEQVFPLPGQ